MSKDYCSLHTHTSYSRLDGLSKIPELLDRMAELGMSAGGISDHGHLNGIIDFYQEAKKRDIKPILGQEFYFTDDRLTRDSVKQYDKGGEIDGSSKLYYHLSVYAENQEGYKNLIQLSSDAYLKGFYRKPRADYSTLEQYGKGLVVGSGCLGGPVCQALLHGNYDGALATAQRLQDIVGKENFFIELMRHGLPEEAKINPLLVSIAKKIGARIYATQDTHYTHAHDHASHDVLICCNTGSKLNDPNRFRFENDQYYLKSADEMYEIFSDLPEACDNTLLIAERCNVEIRFDEMHLPKFDVPAGFHDDNEYLRHLVLEGLKKRYGTLTQEIIDRATYELSVVESMGVSSYMLITWDVIEFLRREGMFTSPGRGSAAGSLICYALEITKVDPIKYGLIFERFLNPSRIALPDIDIDIEQGFRERAINYTVEKYGRDHVSQIITFGGTKSRTAVKDAARVLGYEPWVGDKLTKMMPPLIAGFETPLYACMQEHPKFADGFAAAESLRQEYIVNPDAKTIIDTALGIEGTYRSIGVHAAAVVVGDRPLTELVPIQVTNDGTVVTQFSKDVVEALGLLKMDFLGLKNLDVVSYCQRLIGNGFDVDKAPKDDLKTFQMLSRGESIGCFQIESSGMRSLLRALKPDNINDISAVLALYRPGPMAQDWHNSYAKRKNGMEGAMPFHLDAYEALKETYFLAPYQEQVMALSQRFAGYTMTEADNLRKIMGKKLPDLMAKERGKFVDGCVNQGYTEELGNEIFEMIEGFSAYGFNKSHSMSYGFLTYYTAYLKANYPREYMAALCTYSMDNLDKISLYLGEARRMGLKIYPPSVISSDLGFTVEEDGIRIGLGTLKGIGQSAAQNIIDIREREGFLNLTDFARKVNPKTPALKSLAYSGALDVWGPRMGIVHISEDLMKAVRKDLKKASNLSLFDSFEYSQVDIPNIEFSWHDRLEKEKEVLGVYASGHPLEDYLEHIGNVTIADAREMKEGSKCEFVGIITKVEVKKTRSGSDMAFVDVEDLTGAVQVIVFQKGLNDFGPALVAGSVAKFSVRVSWDSYREEQSYHLNSVSSIASKMATEVPGEIDSSMPRFGVHVPRNFFSSGANHNRLLEILGKYRGETPVDVYVSRTTKRDIGFDFGVEVCENMIMEIKELFNG